MADDTPSRENCIWIPQLRRVRAAVRALGVGLERPHGPARLLGIDAGREVGFGGGGSRTRWAMSGAGGGGGGGVEQQLRSHHGQQQQQQWCAPQRVRLAAPLPLSRCFSILHDLRRLNTGESLS